MLAVFDRIAPTLRKSISFDNDTAFSQHALLRTMRAMTARFCDAYALWEKGGAANADDRLRRWLPRHIDIDKCRTTKSGTSSSSISRRGNASASRSRSSQSSNNSATTCNSAFHKPLHSLQNPRTSGTRVAFEPLLSRNNHDAG
jgi:IS30 family transposase